VRKYLPLVKPFPALHELFERLREDGIKIALASSARDKELQTYKKITGIEPFLAEDTSSDDVSNSKPDPDIFLTARKKLGIDPRNAIAVGDTQYDAESAAKAGMRTVGLLCGGGSRAKLKAAGCIALYRHPADLLNHYEHSPISSGGTKPGASSRSRPDRNEKEKSVSSNNSLYFLIGMVGGAAVGILVAPKSGSEIRAFLKSKSEEGMEYAGRVGADAAEAAKQNDADLKKTAADSIERGKQALQESAEALRSEVATVPKEHPEKSKANPLSQPHSG
jgi:gas vesicle protein